MFLFLLFSCCVRLFVSPWTTAYQASLSFTISQSLLKLMSTCQWCYLTISSSATLFSFCLQFFPASGSFPMSSVFASHGQSTGASALASVLPVNMQGWFLLGLIRLISLHSKGLSRVISRVTWKHTLPFVK